MRVFDARWGGVLFFWFGEGPGSRVGESFALPASTHALRLQWASTLMTSDFVIIDERWIFLTMLCPVLQCFKTVVLSGVWLGHVA